MKQYTLPKSERLYLRESINELFAQGQSFTCFPYRVVYLVKPGVPSVQPTPDASPTPDPRQGRCAIMTVAPKKRFKHAVDRNHVKRLTREAYRLQKLPLHEALEATGRSIEVAFVYADNKIITFEQTHRHIGKALSRLVKVVKA